MFAKYIYTFVKEINQSINIMRHLFITILILNTIQASYSQVFQKLTISNGLSDLSISAIYKDNTGYMWLGGATALNRFDGKNIRQYFFSKPGLRTKMSITNIFQTADSTIWVSNYAGLWKLDKQKDTLFPAIPEIDFAVYGLQEAKDRTLYIATYKGLYIYKNRVLKHILLDKNVMSKQNQIAEIKIDFNNNLWLLTDDHLYYFQSDNGKVAQYKTPKSRNVCLTLLNKNIYIGTYSGKVYRFDTQKKIFYPYMEFASNYPVFQLKDNGKNHLYIASAKLTIVDADSKRIVYTYPSDDVNVNVNGVYSFFIEPCGQIWMSFIQYGVLYNYYSNNLFTIYKYKDFDSSKYPIKKFCTHEAQKLIGTKNGLYYIDEKKGIINKYHIKNVPELKSDMVTSIVRYQDNYYIAFFMSGIFILNPNTLTLNRIQNKELQEVEIFALETDKKGYLWIGEKKGLYSYNETTKNTTFHSIGSIGYQMGIRCIKADEMDRLWLSTAEQLCLFNTNEKYLYPNSAFPTNFPYNQWVINISKNRDGSLLLCLNNGEVIHINTDMNSFYTLFSTDSNKLLMAAQEDDLGNYWFTTDWGIYQLSTKDNKLHTFSPVDGINTPSFSTVLYKDEKGILWIGSYTGLYYVNPKQIQKAPQYSFPVEITDILINGISLSNDKLLFTKSLSDGVKVLTSDSKIEFQCIALNYAQPESNVYEYKLEGYDKEWRYTSENQGISYVHLPHGKYQLKIRLLNQIEYEKSISVIVQRNYIDFIFLASIISFSCLVWLLKKQISTYHKKTKDSILAEKINVHGKNKETLSKYATSHMDNNDFEVLNKKLHEIMLVEKPWKKTDLKLHELANMVGCSPYVLSQMFSTYLNLNFYDYVNQYRVEECKLYISDPQFNKYGIDAISELCGFSSRSSFFRFFKKHTGITPNEFKNRIHKRGH